jgi:hypothetical protein
MIDLWTEIMSHKERIILLTLNEKKKRTNKCFIISFQHA